MLNICLTIYIIYTAAAQSLLPSWRYLHGLSICFLSLFFSLFASRKYFQSAKSENFIDSAQVYFTFTNKHEINTLEHSRFSKHYWRKREKKE